MFGGDKTGISWLFFEHCEQADHHPAMQHHLEKVEAIEVLHCTIYHVTLLMCDLYQPPSGGSQVIRQLSSFTLSATL